MADASSEGLDATFTLYCALRAVHLLCVVRCSGLLRQVAVCVCGQMLRAVLEVDNAGRELRGASFIAELLRLVHRTLQCSQARQSRTHLGLKQFMQSSAGTPPSRRAMYVVGKCKGIRVQSTPSRTATSVVTLTTTHLQVPISSHIMILNTTMMHGQDIASRCRRERIHRAASERPTTIYLTNTER